MAATLSRTLGTQFAGLSQLPAHRQFGMVVGLAVVAALGVVIVLWGARPGYQVLLPGMDGRDAAQAMSVLSRHGIPHRLEQASGSLMVPGNRIHEARLNLATEGLPRAEGVGFELLDRDTGLGTSRMVETARYQRALEGELARSVMTLSSVAAARVHLALPRQSAFVRDRVKPSASVLVHLHPGRQLDENQIAGIVHLLAASVPELEIERVTVLDQRGRLLSQTAGDLPGAAAGQQLDYTRRIEEALRRRVEDILAPLVGEEGMRVQVTAEIDFTQVESTRETFDPESQAVRSEQLVEEESRGMLSGGVPGALTNQPPAAATVADAGLAIEEATAGADGQNGPVQRNRRSTRNFEMDRTISHIRQAPARLNRLSVAVVVDHRELTGQDGQPLRVPRDSEEMAYLLDLVRETVGFNEERGDRVNVVNGSFREIEPVPPLPPLPLWQEPWIGDLLRHALAGLGLLLLVLLVLRPALKGLAQVGAAPVAALPGTRSGQAVGGRPGQLPGGQTAGGGGQELIQGSRNEDGVSHARTVAQQDPRLAAQVVRQWMNSNEK